MFVQLYSLPHIWLRLYELGRRNEVVRILDSEHLGHMRSKETPLLTGQHIVGYFVRLCATDTKFSSREGERHQNLIEKRT